ncbi:MAG TPA: BMC domain-containing protein [Candidatus Ornithomonoglobus intestinigallinarum]|uniref:BMC domain-containing protein n=1 Tax=Candidatus Ornithomonoglobus intestinigallinarum TaxID=2840894 RepID=A0A9D1H2L9_9FIRM|nr:BMC domain-containing protein [Candidatus Ornithomonoglobus intestinigallinarum]
MKALGFLETRSLTAAIEASDAMTKAADVRVVGTEKIGSGLVNVVIEGDVDAVNAAVAAGVAAAKEIGEVYASNVIPRPHDEVARVLPTI